METPETHEVAAPQVITIDDVLSMDDFAETDAHIIRRDGTGAEMSAWGLFSSGEPFDLADWMRADPTATVVM